MFSLGLVGCGEIATTQHMPAVLRSQECAITVVADVDQERARATAERFAIATWTDSPRELLERPIDGVILATPPTVTPHLASMALEAGIPVLCEKPIGVDLPSAARLVLTVEATGVPCQVGYKNRFAPLIVELRSWFEQLHNRDPLLARLASFDEVFNPSTASPEFVARTKATLESGDPMVHEGTHHIDLLTWLLGDVASIDHVSRVRFHSTEILQPHYTTASLRFGAGHSAVIEVGWCFPHSVKGEFQLWAPSGFAEVSRDRSTLFSTDGLTTNLVKGSSDWQSGAFDGQLRAFAALIGGGPQTGATAQEAYRSLEVALGIVSTAELTTLRLS